MTLASLPRLPVRRETFCYNLRTHPHRHIVSVLADVSKNILSFRWLNTHIF